MPLINRGNSILRLKLKTEMCLLLNKRTSKTKYSIRRRKSNFIKGDYHLHSTLKQKLNVLFVLRTQHNIKLLYKVFNINRNTYYKYISNNILPRIEENQMISKNSWRLR